MTLPILQCGTCKHNLRSYITEDNFPGIDICDQYPEQVPDFVLEATGDCPKYEEK